MNQDLNTQRIIESILQVLIAPLCIAVTWARMTPSGLGVKADWQKINFLDAGYQLTGNYMMTIIIVVCTVLVLALIWTKVYYLAVIPAGIQFLVILITYGYFLHLRNLDEAFVDILGIVHSALVLTGFMIALLMMKGHVDARKKNSDSV